MGALHRLTAVEVKNARAGKYADGGGLWLAKSSNGAGKWFFRYTYFGRRREMGLGSVATVSLKQARELAARWREEVSSGRDPIRERDAAAKALRREDTSLRVIAEEAFEARKAELKGDGKAGRWFSPLELHILPKLGKMPIEEIDQRDIKEVLAQIWHTKADPARKSLNRLGIVFKHAAAMGLEVDLQAPAKAKALLGHTRHQGKHIDALPWQEVPDFYASLDEPTITHLALRLLILTGMRSRPIRYLRLEQLEGDIWTVPGEEMKGRKGRTPDFRVPLSTEAQAVITLAKPYARDGYLFPSARKGVISDATMARLMERRGMKARPHGFRSSLRVWLAEKTDASHEISERILGHSVGTLISRAYQRSDQIEQRRVLLQAWSDHVIQHVDRTEGTKDTTETAQNHGGQRRYLPLFDANGAMVERPDLMIFAATSATNVNEIAKLHSSMVLEEARHAGTDRLSQVGKNIEKKFIRSGLEDRVKAGRVALSFIQIAKLTKKPPSLRAACALTAYRECELRSSFDGLKSEFREVRRQFSLYRDISHFLAVYFLVQLGKIDNFERDPECTLIFYKCAKGIELYIDYNVVSQRFEWHPIRVPEMIKPATKSDRF